MTQRRTKVISISLDPQLQKDVEKFSNDSETNFSQTVAKALRLFLAQQEWEEIRSSFSPALLKMGIDSDEDVENYFK